MTRVLADRPRGTRTGTDDEPARWFDHWEDGASREDAGLREDHEMQRREDEYR
jgi:hypothetical protein